MQEEPKILYHYTSMATLLKILQGVEETGKLTLRGTHIEYLNDKTELNISFELIIQAVIDYEKELGQDRLSERLNVHILKKIVTMFESLPFITSFSKISDSLPMWSTYAEKGQGVAIGILSFEEWTEDFNLEDQGTVFGICDYSIEELVNAFKNGFIENLCKNLTIKDNLVQLSRPYNGLSKTISLLKNKAFEYEQEIRLIRTSQAKHENEIKFFECNGLLKPYVENIMPKTVLKEIVIGPCIDFELSKQSLEMCLRRSGYATHKNELHFVEIKQSQVPYRLI